MSKKTSKNRNNLVVLILFAAVFGVAFAFFGFGTTQADANFFECKDGSLRADLKGADEAGKGSSGTAQHLKDKKNKSLIVMVTAVIAAEGTKLPVVIGDLTVGEITVSKTGDGQIKIDSSPDITEGTTVSVKKGDATLLSGSFVCAGKKGTEEPAPSPSPKMTVEPQPTATPMPNPTVK